MGIKFPLDRRGGNSIRDGWVDDMTHCCTTFIKPKGKFSTEELVIYKVDETHYLQGYIDLIRENKDGTISIIDWKTSSQFQNKDLIHHGRQLIFYAMAKEQEGFKVKDVMWVMLKYVQCSFMGKARKGSKKDTLITKVIERRKILTELKPYIEQDLISLGYDEIDIDCMFAEAKNNSLEIFPKQIQEKYIIKPYVRKYELTDELREETLNYINRLSSVFEKLDASPESSWKPKQFLNNKGKEDTFYCNCLCNHRYTCKYIKEFNDLKNLKTETSNDEDLF